MGNLLAAAKLNLVGKIIYNNLYQWVQGWSQDARLVSSFAITVILFTIFLKLATLPLDIWQKILTRNNAKKMEIMKPEIDKLQAKFGSDKEALMLKQREVHKKYKYNAFAACLPSIVTMVIFFIVFSGFNSAVRYHNEKTFEKLEEVYSITIKESKEKYELEFPDNRELVDELAVKDAEEAVVNAYKPEKFFLTKNVFMPDTWKQPVPDVYTFAGTGLGKLGIKDVEREDYNRIMTPVIEKYNKTEANKKVWNGFLILPLLSILLNFVSSILMKPPEQPAMAGQTAEQQKMQKSQAKMMQYMMPILMGIFALLYSAAFTLYITLSAAITLLVTSLFNMVTKIIDKKEKGSDIEVIIK